MAVLTGIVPNWGEDFRDLSPEALNPQGQNMGDVSAQSIPMTDANEGLTSDGSDLFNDSDDQRSNAGMDAMEGLADNRRIEILRDEQMYATQPAIDFPFPLPETASPELEQS